MTQPPLTRETVCALSGRELDAVVSVHIFANDPLPTDYDSFRWGGTPQYTYDDYRGLAAMVDQAHASGWTAEIDDFGDSWHVRLSHSVDGYYDRYEGANGDTLPTAFARALLLTTLPENSGRAASERR